MNFVISHLKVLLTAFVSLLLIWPAEACEQHIIIQNKTKLFQLCINSTKEKTQNTKEQFAKDSDVPATENTLMPELDTSTRGRVYRTRILRTKSPNPPSSKQLKKKVESPAIVITKKATPVVVTGLRFEHFTKKPRINIEDNDLFIVYMLSVVIMLLLLLSVSLYTTKVVWPAEDTVTSSIKRNSNVKSKKKKGSDLTSEQQTCTMDVENHLSSEVDQYEQHIPDY